MRDFRDSEAIKEYCKKNDVNAYVGFSRDNRETRAWVDLASKDKVVSIFTYTDNKTSKFKSISPAQRVLVSLGNYIKNCLNCADIDKPNANTYECIPVCKLSDEKCRKIVKERTPLKYEINCFDIYEKFI